MRNKLRSLKTTFTNKKSSRHNLILTVVALVEIIMIMVVSTVAWVETTSSLEISGSGNIDTFTYSTANIGSGEGYDGKVIDLSDYFRSAGNVHLAAASSADGENIYFPVANRAGSTTDTYRKGNINDKNVNYISFDFKLKAATSTCDFYLAKEPTIKIDGTQISNNDVRIAVTALGNTTIYSNTDATEKVVSSVDGTKSTTTVEAFSKHVDSATAPDNTELFEVKSAATETVTITLWLQESAQSTESYAGKTVTVEDFELVAGAAKVYFVDYTTGFNGPVSETDPTEANSWHWVDNEEPQLLIYDGNQSYLMTKDKDFSTNYTWVSRVPQSVIDDTSRTLYFCRCANGVKSINSLTDANVYNYWVATVQNAKTENSTAYKAYGATKTNSKEGYGTWGNLIEIQLDTEHTILPKPTESINATGITLTNSTNTSVVCQMNYHEGLWRGFVPEADSASFTVSFNDVEITASNRDTSEPVSEFFVTSPTTGYWAPPAKVIVHSNNTEAGTVSISGGAEGATSVMVTAGTKLTLSATANEGYNFDGWYSDENYKTQLTSTEVTAPAKKAIANYYAKFSIKKFNVYAYAYTEGSNTSTGGTVQVSTSTATGAKGAISSLSVNYNTSVTYTASVADGYSFGGWYSEATGGTKVSSELSLTRTITSDDGTTYYARFTQQGTTVYFRPSTTWAAMNSSNVRYAAYMWDSNGSKWYDLTGPDANGCYKFTYQESYTNIIFCCMNGSTTENKWGNKLAQTGNLTVNTTKNCYDMANDKNDWVSYPPSAISTNVTITFTDSTSGSWIKNDEARMFMLVDGEAKEMSTTDSKNWTLTLTSTPTSIDFYRCTRGGYANTKQTDSSTTNAGYYNKWTSTGYSAGKTTYSAKGDGSGSWS